MKKYSKFLFLCALMLPCFPVASMWRSISNKQLIPTIIAVSLMKIGVFLFSPVNDINEVNSEHDNVSEDQDLENPEERFKEVFDDLENQSKKQL